MSSVDSTDYGKRPRPEQQLRNLFATLRIHTPIRLKLAAAGVVTLKLIAMTGSDPDSALAGLSEFLTAEDWPTGGMERLERLKIKALWDSAKAQAATLDLQQAKYAEDPTKIPMIAENERLLMRANWVAAHPTHELSDYNEPHPRFLEKVRRDWIIHGRVVLYDLLEIRVKHDKVITKAAVYATCDKLLQAVQEELPGSPADTAEQVFDRLHAMFVTFEYCQILEPLQYETLSLRYLRELRAFHREHGSHLALLVKVDTKLRRFVDKEAVKNFTKPYVDIFLDVLQNKKYLWDSALVDFEAHRFSTPTRSTKRTSDELSSESPAASPGKRPGKKARQRAAKAKGKAAPPSQQHKGGKGGGKGGGKSSPPSGKGTSKGGFALLARQDPPARARQAVGAAEEVSELRRVQVLQLLRRLLPGQRLPVEAQVLRVRWPPLVGTSPQRVGGSAAGPPRGHSCPKEAS